MPERYFRVKQENACSNLRRFLTGVPQGSVLGQNLDLLYTSDWPTFNEDTLLHLLMMRQFWLLVVATWNQRENSKQLMTRCKAGQRSGVSKKTKLNHCTNRRINHHQVYINYQFV